MHTVTKVFMATHHFPATLVVTPLVVVAGGISAVERGRVVDVIIAECRHLKADMCMDEERNISWATLN